MNESILRKDELDFIVKYIKVNENLLETNLISSNRKILRLNSNSPSLFFDIKKRILIKENILINYIDNSKYGDYIGLITEGGKIHRHKDSTIDGYDHVRFNLFLSVPKKGGFPIYNKKTIPVKIGEYVRCNSSTEYHECETVEGDVPRIVISYGIYLKKESSKNSIIQLDYS